ncbi:ABC transporter substrate-binding protein [Propionibacteriaceae bacterium Y1685]
MNLSGWRHAALGRFAVMGLGATLALTACGGSAGDNPGAPEKITVWTLEDVQSRIDATNAIADKFTAASGVEVEVVAVAEDQYPQLITNAAAADQLPDVVASLGLSGVHDLDAKELLDPDMAADLVEELGPQTFSERALALSKDPEGNQLAVPSDGWGQIMVYRKDLFDKAGLAAPDSYESIQAAAEKLNSDDRSGITISTAPGDGFTQQTFEQFALGNGCQLVDGQGAVTLNSPQCAASFDYYGKLAGEYGPAGNQDVDSTRASYFAGKAAMTVWSTYILDEMAGLRSDALPTCPECTDDPEFLAKNSGIVTAIKGPDGEPAQYGEIASWAILDGADDSTADFLRAMMGEHYTEWLALAPEGKVPVRKGTAENPTEYTDAWQQLETGVDTRKKLSDVYDAETLQVLTDGPETFQRWGIEQGKGALAGAMLAELPVPKALAEVVAGKADGAKAAADAQKAVEDINQDLG